MGKVARDAEVKQGDGRQSPSDKGASEHIPARSAQRWEANGEKGGGEKKEGRQAGPKIEKDKERYFRPYKNWVHTSTPAHRTKQLKYIYSGIF